MSMVITEACVGCKHKRCVAVCPVESFHEGETMLYVNPQTCIDCDACISECPVEAIYRDSEVPAEMLRYIGINAEGARLCPVASAP